MFVMLARNGVLFLIAWEIMALASFFLVIFEHEDAAVREAGWVYLIATHLGSAFLLVMFVLMAKASGSYDFEAWDKLPMGPAFAGLLFLLAVIGFGTKAGFIPMHVWLPEAHPAAPSHVSALMSGVMIKTGIYGLVRLYTLLLAPPNWCGWLLVGVGLSSGILGVLFALAQHDLKRLLAYHSVENIGIISLGLGLGMLGAASGSASLAVLGFGGGLLHVLNHALFKALLFLGAGSILHSTGVRELDHLGGLLKRMPWTGATFLVGAAAISGLPPLNGFVSEFLIYLGSFKSVISTRAPASAVPALLAIAGLALIGGLASACFAKAFGIVFLGEPRTRRAEEARESNAAMTLPMAILAAACVLIGLLPWVVLKAMGPLLEAVTRLPAGEVQSVLVETGDILSWVSAGACLLLGLGLLLVVLRELLLSGRKVETALTWDCGYALPTPRMQYTASSFAQPLLAFFSPFLRTRERQAGLKGYFPGASSWASETRDTYRELVFEPLFAGCREILGRMRGIQQGRIQIYVLYVGLALLALLLWALGTAP
ncbi:MAG: proton-conducting transporter membrane subunit, partial [candidate division NC10 bacterium]